MNLNNITQKEINEINDSVIRKFGDDAPLLNVEDSEVLFELTTKGTLVSYNPIKLAIDLLNLVIKSK